MPFKSDKQRKFLFANKPKMAKKWAKEEKERSMNSNTDPVAKKALKKMDKKKNCKMDKKFKM